MFSGLEIHGVIASFWYLIKGLQGAIDISLRFTAFSLRPMDKKYNLLCTLTPVLARVPTACKDITTKRDGQSEGKSPFLHRPNCSTAFKISTLYRA